MKTFATAAVGAALLATSFAATAEAAPRHHHHWGWGGAGAGLATGLIVGGVVGAAAAGAYGPYYGPAPYTAYGPGPTYYQAPPAVVYGDRVVKERGCVSSTRYDYQGQPYTWKDCQ
jgi:hypothetical protein